MGGKPLSETKADKLVYEIYPEPKEVPTYLPEKIRSEKIVNYVDKIDRKDTDHDEVMKIYKAYDSDITPTYWGLFNAVAEYENYGRVKKNGTNRSIIEGGRSKTMNLAFWILSAESGANAVM